MNDEVYPMGSFASHLPVLKALKPPPKKVLEYGAGEHSTEAFLEMSSVTKLVTVETDHGWREKIAKKHAKELKGDRWTLLEANDEVKDLSDFDLIFIDDGLTPDQRHRTIGEVLRQKHPKVIIHDADHAPYVDSIRMFTEDYVIEDAYSPHTAVVAASKGTKR